MYQLLNYISFKQFRIEAQNNFILKHNINAETVWKQLKVNPNCFLSISDSADENLTHNVIICIYATSFDNYKDILQQCCFMTLDRLKNEGVLSANYYIYYNFPIYWDDKDTVERIMNKNEICSHNDKNYIEEYLRTTNNYNKHFQRVDYLKHSQDLIESILDSSNNNLFFTLDNDESIAVLKYILVYINDLYDFREIPKYQKDLLISFRHNLENYLLSLWKIVINSTLNTELTGIKTNKASIKEDSLWTKRDFLSLILFLLWDVEFTNDFCTMVYQLHRELVQHINSCNLSKKEKQKLDFFGRFITKSQIDFFTFEDDDRFPPLLKGNKAIDLYSIIINSSKYLKHQDREFLKVCCKIKKPLESVLFSIAEKKMIDSYPNLHQISNDKETVKRKSYNDIRNTDIIYSLSYLSTHDLEWFYILKNSYDNVLWDMKIVIDVVDSQTCNIRISPVKTNSFWEENISNIELSIGRINSAIEQRMLIKHTITSEIVGIFYEKQYDGRIPQRSLSFEKGLSITKDTEGTYHFHYEENGSKPTSFFYDDNPGNCIVSNVIAIVGKNGTGKTTAFRMINMDSPNFSDDNQKFDDYIIIYRIRDNYYYSSNNENLNIEGLGDIYNLSKDRSKNSNVIFYNGSISMNSLISNNKVNGIDISNEYIFRNELMEKGKQLYDAGRKLQLFKELGENAFYNVNFR